MRMISEAELAGHPAGVEAYLPISLDPRQVLQRLPLADGLLALLGFVLSPEDLRQAFREHRGRSFELALGFPTFVRLIGDALLQHNGSGRQSFQRARQDGSLTVSIEATYGKLRRVPVSLSLGLLAAGSAGLRDLFPEAVVAWEVPASLAGFHPVILDGKTIKGVAKRLKATRGAPGKLSGGKLLVALSARTGMVLTMAADPDGEANEARLVPEVITRVNAEVPANRLFIADRQHGDPVQIGRYVEQEGDHVIARWDNKTTFHPDPNRPSKRDADARGREVVQDWGLLGAESNKRRRYLRRVTLIRPGEEPVALLTDLLDEDLYPADDLLRAYLARWGIERVFQQITEVFSLNRLIGTTPQATIFQASFCLLLYNLIQVARAYIAAGRADLATTEDLSGEQIFYDARRQLIGLYEVLSVPELQACLGRPWDRESLKAWLSSRLGGLWDERWTKARNRKPRPQKTKAGPSFGAHNSVHRLVTRPKAEAKPP